jgi:hypothetical protein
VILALAMAMTAGALQAQEANSLVGVHPYLLSNRDMVRDSLKPPRFWTRSTIALVALDGAAMAADSFCHVL